MTPEIHDLLDHLVEESQRILQAKFVGFYLHGSLAMGCFNPDVSDVDFLIVVDEALTDPEARALLDVMVAANNDAPPKGLEMSVVERRVLNPFIYPTPHELHFSPYHLAAYHKDPEEYIEQRRSKDPDLAAHITILHAYGQAWVGPAIKEVFGEVSHEAYLDSLLLDQADPVQDILQNPPYVILNLCRVLAYVREGHILSKAKAALWALNHLSDDRNQVIESALRYYTKNIPVDVQEERLVAFGSYMQAKIHEALESGH